MKISCPEVQERLSAWLDGELAGPEHDLVAVHLDGCGGCRRELARLRALDAALGKLSAAVPPELAAKVLARLPQAPQSRPWWQSMALAASLVLGLVLGGTVARDFYPQVSFPAPSNGTTEVASFQDFHDFPQGSLGTILASYQPEEGNDT